MKREKGGRTTGNGCQSSAEGEEKRVIDGEHSGDWMTNEDLVNRLRFVVTLLQN